MQEAKQTFSQLASRLATDSSQPKSKVIADLYGRLNLILMRANSFRPIGLFTEVHIGAEWVCISVLYK